MLANRLSKRFRHLSKWSAREDAPCFRVYERDIPEFPLVIDWYEGEVVVWFHPRTRDDTPEREEAFHRLAIDEICAGLQVGADRLWIKRRERQRGLAQYERMGERNAIRTVREQGLRFEVNLSDFLDTGLFLDHRITRRMVRERSAGRRVLNLFAYTGSFTSYAAHGGARATRTVDMSRTYLDWGRRNLALNRLNDDARHEFTHADCLELLRAGPRPGERYDIIVLDPPTFSNSKRMSDASFAVERDWPSLIASALPWLERAGQLWFSTNARGFSLDAAALPQGWAAREITRYTMPEDFGGSAAAAPDQRPAHRAWIIASAEVPGALDLRVRAPEAPPAR